MIPTPLLYRRSLIDVETFSDGVTASFSHLNCTGKIRPNARLATPKKRVGAGGKTNLEATRGGILLLLIMSFMSEDLVSAERRVAADCPWYSMFVFYPHQRIIRDGSPITSMYFFLSERGGEKRIEEERRGREENRREERRRREKVWQWVWNVHTTVPDDSILCYPVAQELGAGIVEMCI